MELSLGAMVKRYGDEGQAWLDLESIVWPHGPVCPHCGVINHAYFLNPKKPRTTRTGNPTFRRVWKCGECRKQFSVLKGTIFEDSKIPVSKWLLAFYLMSSSKNGVAAYELHRTLDITYEAAWFMCHRIRHAFAPTTHKRVLTGTVEADETYMGGKRKRIPGIPTRALKVPVVTLVERDGEARSQAMTEVTAANLKSHLSQNIAPDANLMTDESSLYTKVGREFASHEVVDHSHDEYVRGNAYTNTAEGYFSQLKRSIDGTHHHVSARHLPRYLSEFDFRYNTRKESDSDRTKQGIRSGRGKRLKYEHTARHSE